MSVPATGAQFIAVVRKSNLVPPESLDAFVAQLAQRGEAELRPETLAVRLMDAGLLTRFQAEQCLQGKWRGFTIGKFKVLERLGSGGMGSVYLCEHIHMRHKVAVKVLPTAKSNDPAALGRFYREARAAGVLDHPNLVRAHDVDQEGELHYLVMDYVDGVSLQHLVSKITGPLPLPRACNYIWQAAQGLQHAARTGLVHRDIKPANILLDRQGVVKVLDMGLARFFDDHQDLLTLKYDDKNVLGTADYVSPEQALNSHQVDIRTDIYSLGATLYFLLAGKTLFPEGKAAQKLMWHQTREPAPLRELRPEVPEGLAVVVHKMIAKDKEKRYQNWDEVLAALAPWGDVAVPPPADEEIPLLSLAARTPSSVSAGASSAHSPPRRRGVELVRNSPARPRPTVATVGLEGDSRNGQPHDSAGAEHTPRFLAADLPTLRNDSSPGSSGPAADTHRNAQTEVTPAPTTPRRTRRLVIFLAATVLGATAGVGLRYAMQLAARQTPPPVADSLLIVSRSGAPGTHATVRAALEKARPGDCVQIREEVWQETLKLEGNLGQGVTIEGAGPRPTIWRVPAGEKSAVSIASVAGLRFRNLTFDGQGRIGHLLSISGPCPGLTLEGLQFRDFCGAAIRLASCKGEADKPVSLRLIRFVSTWPEAAGLSLEGLADQECRHLIVENCRFEGMGQAFVISGSVSDARLGFNRIHRTADGLLIRKGSSACTVNLTLACSTFCEIRGAAVRLEGPLGPDSKLHLEKNLYSLTGALIQTEGKDLPAGLSVQGCVRDPSSTDGVSGLQVQVVEFRLPTDAGDDNQFLRYPKDGPVARAGNPGVP